jgi:hypothetical protein
VPPFLATHPRNIPAAYYKPIGQIITRWGFTELYLQSIVWHIWGLKDPKAARALTWNINVVQKVKLFRFLGERWIPDAAAKIELQQIHAEVEDLRKKRNWLAHAVWGRDPARPTKLFMFYLPDIDKQILPEAKQPSLAEVKGWASKLDKLNRRIQAFHKKLGAPRP